MGEGERNISNFLANLSNILSAIEKQRPSNFNDFFFRIFTNVFFLWQLWNNTQIVIWCIISIELFILKIFSYTVYNVLDGVGTCRQFTDRWSFDGVDRFDIKYCVHSIQYLWSILLLSYTTFHIIHTVYNVLAVMFVSSCILNCISKNR